MGGSSSFDGAMKVSASPAPAGVGDAAMDDLSNVGQPLDGGGVEDTSLVIDQQLIACKPISGDEGGGGGEGTPMFNLSHISAAVDASIAWLDDGTEDVATGAVQWEQAEGAEEAGAMDGSLWTAGGSSMPHVQSRAEEEDKVVAGASEASPKWTMVHSLLRALPTLAATTAAATHATRAGSTICGVVSARDSGLGVDPRIAAGTFRAVVHVLTNLTNENPAGCAAVRAAGGIAAAAALVPWCASLEGLVPGAGPSREAAAAAAARSGGAGGACGRARGGGSVRVPSSIKEEAAASSPEFGSDMLNAALCFLVNLAEMDTQACVSLRTLEADVGALEERRGAASMIRGRAIIGAARGGRAGAGSGPYARPLGLVELLTQMFVRSGGAGAVDRDGNVVAAASATNAASAPTIVAATAAIPHPSGSGGDVTVGQGGVDIGVDVAVPVSPHEDDSEETDDNSGGEVTAEMLDAREKEDDGLITQAYAALLVGFLIEGQPALRAEVVCTLPAGGLASLAEVSPP